MSFMVDWLKYEIPYNGPEIFGGRRIIIDENENITLDTSLWKNFSSSYETRISLMSFGGKLHINGNPNKFLSGQNVFGSGDASYLAERMYDWLRQHLKLSKKELPSPFGLLSKIDLTANYYLDSNDDVQNWIHAAQKYSGSKFGKTDTTYNSTIYYNKNSRRRAAKIYNKYLDVLDNPDRYPILTKLSTVDLHNFTEYIKHLLRVEMVLHNMYLKDRASAENKWEGTNDFMYQKYMSKHSFRNIESWDESKCINEYVRCMDMIKLPKTAEQFTRIPDLNHKLMATFMLWRDGQPLRKIMSKSAYYRHKAELLTHNIDISLPVADTKDFSLKVIPLFKTIMAEPAEVPDYLQYLNYGNGA